MSKRVLILVGIPDFDYTNQMSAVASFLQTIKTAFDNTGAIVDFGNDVSIVRDNKQPQKSQNGGFKAGIKTVVQKWPWLYQSLAFKSYFKRQNIIFSKLSKSKPYDLVIEFHTVGSTVGQQLASLWNCELSVIFDSPVEEQFYEMHGTKTVHWKQILRSEKYTLEAANRIMAYSPACEKHIRTKYSIQGKVSVLPCVVNKEKTVCKANNDPFNILFVGSFLKWHKVSQLVLAFQKFVRTYPNAKLQLIGYGVEWEKNKKLIELIQLQELVELPGFVSEEELLRYKQNSSVAIMPGSNWYGSPLKLFEYAQSGIPFIAPTTKTVSEIFEKEEHCLFIDPLNEQDSIIEKLSYLIENPEDGKEMANRAKDYVKAQFEDVVYAEKLVEVLSQ